MSRRTTPRAVPSLFRARTHRWPEPVELGDGYKVAIPFVNSDIYTATLDYVATTL
jgi:hypothetical protein